MNGNSHEDPAAAGGAESAMPKLASAMAAAVVLAAALGLAAPAQRASGPVAGLFQRFLMDADRQPAGRAPAEAPMTGADAAAATRTRSRAPAAATSDSPPLREEAIGFGEGALLAASLPEAAPPLDVESRRTKWPPPAGAEAFARQATATAKEQARRAHSPGGDKSRALGAGEGDQAAQNSRPALERKVAPAVSAADAPAPALLAGAGPVRGQPDAVREQARRFLAEHERLSGLRFQAASGYWANTYVPGDPVMRLLEARLQRWHRDLPGAPTLDAGLETAVRQNRQPFDPPRGAALAAYLHADKAAVHGASRLRVQVGLQASQRRSGLRPDMNVGVVLDLRRPPDAATAAKLRALVFALLRARQPGDRFSITVAGHPGGLIVPADAFRHGPVRVAMQSLLAGSAPIRGPAMDLLAALHSAADNIRQGDDTAAPLGASLVLLVSTASMSEQRQSLERLAHENALAGVTLSVVAAGDTEDLATIDGLVLLGQGHRRVLASAEDAADLVDRELHAASRAVARALRLRIRLAPGVKLIDVLGSTNLSARAAERERATERSIDRRMARNIGIRADRGRDEEGIQILIPSFYAGDNHSVLLDVLVPGPGPVADLSVRYKDLVYRRNGTVRARLALADGVRARGPLENNVLKNHLAQALADAAATAAGQLGAGDQRAALLTLATARDLVAGMREEIPGWERDEELGNDQALLSRYVTALGSGFAGIHENRSRLADSLRYLAFRRLTPPLR